jgi:hypothetical protein
MRTLLAKITLMTVMAMLTASCGGDDAGDEAESADSDVPPADDETTGDDGADDDAESEDPDDEEVRTASFRGVTPDTIRLGALGIDFDALRELGLVDIDFGDQELAFNVFADELNARGGINGRQVEVHYRTYSVLSAETGLAACLELTEDLEVFAMLNGFQGPAQESDNCFANDHETILLGSVGSNEEMTAAKAPWIQVGLSGNTRLDLAMIGLADGEGLFDDEVVGVHAIAASADRIDPVVTRLEELGVDVALETVNDAGDDPAAGEAIWRILAENIRSEGITTLVILGPGSFEVGQMIDLGVDVKVINSDIAVGGLSTFDNHDPAAYDGVIGTFGTTAEEGEDDPGIDACVDTFEAATGIDVLPASELEEGDTNHGVSVLFACSRFSLFEQLAGLAGVNLTNDSFRAAIESGADIDLPGPGLVSFGPDKYDGNDGVRLGVLDSTLEDTSWRPVTDLVRLDD